MVDSTKGIGPIQPIQSGKPQSQPSAKKADETQESRRTEDLVEISQEALDQARAERAAQDARDTLKENQDLSLGLDASLLDEQA